MRTPNGTLVEAAWKGKPQRCDASNCTRSIGPGESFFIDKMSEASYCQQCGTSLRYHRKKAGDRGESLPLTFEDVENRIQR